MGKNEVKIGAVLSYIIIGLNAIIGIFYTPFLTRMLGQSEYGLYSLVNSIISYITILDFGFGNAIIVYTSKFLAKKDKVGERKLHGMFLLIYIVIGLIAGIVGVVLYCNVDAMFGNTMTVEEIETGKILMAILTFNLAITFPFSIFTNIITAYEKFVFSKCLNIIRVIALPLCMTPLLIFGYKSIALVLLITVINIAVLLANMIFCFKKLNLKFVFKNFDYKLLKEIFIYSFFIFLNIFVDKANWQADRFILGALCNTSAVAIYSVSVQFYMIYETFSTAISGVLLPKISKLEESNATDEAFSDIFIKTGRLQWIIMGLVLSGFVIFGQCFINTLFGDEYYDSYLIAVIILIPSTVPLIQNVGLSILQAKNKYAFRAVVYFFIAIFNIVISSLLAKDYEGVGCAIGTATAIIIGNICFINIYYKVKIHLDIKRFWWEILKLTFLIVLLGVPFYILINMIPLSSTIYLCLGIPVYTVFYILILAIFGMNKYEKNLLLKPIINKLFKKEL